MFGCISIRFLKTCPRCRWMKAKIGCTVGCRMLWRLAGSENQNVKCETHPSNISKFIGYQFLIFYKFQRSSLQRAPFVEGAGSKKARAPWPWPHVISCGRGPTLECLRTHAWEINQPHGLPQPSIDGYALQLLLAANFHTLDSYAFLLPWREDK